MARKRTMSRRERNQAKWNAHAATQTKPSSAPAPIMAGLGSYAGGQAPTLHTGSVQSTPSKPTVTQRKGIRLMPFTDYVPRVPSDYATTDPTHMNDRPIYDQKTGKRQIQTTPPAREVMEHERARLATRPSTEVASMSADRPSGAESFITYGERHEADVKAGLFRDGMGRVMRTTDMDDELSTYDYATVYGAPMVRTRATMRDERAAERAAELKVKRANRQAARDQRDADRAQRRLDRMTGKSGANTDARRNLDEAARAYLKTFGIDNPDPIALRAAREVIEHAKQVAQYEAAMKIGA